MRPLCALALGLWASAAFAAAAEAPAAGGEKDTTPGDKPDRLIVVQDKTPLMFGNEVVGQVAEGTRLELVRTHQAYSLVRATFGENWFQGWIRTALTVPDTLKDVDIQVGHATRTYVFENLTAPGGTQFLVVKIRFTPTDQSPSRVYFSFADEASADLYLSYGRDQKTLPYGFLRRKPMSKRRVFERTEKQQVLLFQPGEMLEETYIFTVPVRAKAFDLVLKDLVQPVRMRP